MVHEEKSILFEDKKQFSIESVQDSINRKRSAIIEEMARDNVPVWKRRLVYCCRWKWFTTLLGVVGSKNKGYCVVIDQLPLFEGDTLRENIALRKDGKVIAQREFRIGYKMKVCKSSGEKIDGF